MMRHLDGKIYISGWDDAEKAMKSLNRTYVVTVAVDSPVTGHQKFSLVDGPGNDPEVFRLAVDVVVRAAQSAIESAILVHCVSGRSRSAAVCVAAIAKLNNISICEAYDRCIAIDDKIRIHPALGKLLLP
jgi:chemotaxis response regulator CheB